MCQFKPLILLPEFCTPVKKHAVIAWLIQHVRSTIKMSLVFIEGVFHGQY